MPYTAPNMKAGSSFSTLMSHQNSSSRFYLMDNEDSTSKESLASLQSSDPTEKPISFPQNRLMVSRSSSVASVLNAENDERLDKLLKFVTESPQSYSYTLMSTNSLALRLKVLKRSIEILLTNRQLLNSSLQTIPPEIPNDTSRPSVDRRASSSTLQSLLSTHVASASASLSKSSALPSSTTLTLAGNSQSLTVNKSFLKDLREFVDMLEQGVGSDMSSDQQKTIMTLHNLSLSSVDNIEAKNRRTELQSQLLHALAMPFIEQQFSIAKSQLYTDSELEMQSQSSIRQVHSSATGKNQSPKAIFTVNARSPWDIKNINDIGLLMFGISKSSIGKINLIDLISPRSRSLVYKRLQRCANLVFDGEVIAVNRENMGVAWTSIWAKRINDRIFMILEQISCDTIDVVIERTKEHMEDYLVQNVIQQSNGLFSENLRSFNLNYFLPTISKALEFGKDENYIAEDESYSDSKLINKVRYFTLGVENGKFVPAAVTSEALIEPDENFENSNVVSRIRLNLHSLPYIAGSFVISAKTHRIMSFNEAIAKNLFGRAGLKDSIIDTILPGFDLLLKTAETENPNMINQEGLVLPEHYFRKLGAWGKTTYSDERETAFLKSKGVRGLHNDGNPITVDVQLRVAQKGIYVLWITFSRSSTVAVHDDNKTDKKKYNSNDNINLKNMPSQLHLMSMHRDDSSDLSRNPSIKSISGSTNNTTSNLNTPRIDSSSSLVSSSSSWDDNSSSLESKQFSKSSSKDLLAQEEAYLEELREKCPHFPKKIGAERRSKTVHDFKNLKNLGSGAYGKVWLGRHHEDKAYEVCIKSIVKERILVDTWVRDRVLGTIPAEIQILYTISKNPHGNILRLVDFFEDNDYYHIETLPIKDTVDLYDLIELKKDTMNERECAYIFYQVVSAMNHLHNMGIIHRDIKDENIIIDETYSVKLIDFGSSAFIKDGPFKVFLGTLEYASPEVLDGSYYDGTKQDVWAVGVLLFTLVFKENPFLQVDEILEAKVNFPSHTVASDSCVELIEKILVAEPNDRPTMQEILAHKWLEGF